MLEFHVPAMSCGHCVRAITEAVQEVDPRAKVDVDLTSKQVKVQTAEGREPIVAALREAGYEPEDA